MRRAISTITIFLFVNCLATAASSETLKLVIETTSDVGNIYAAIYSSAYAFDEKNAITTGVVGAASGGKTALEIHNLKPSTYGISLFHDLNDNEVLDRNLFGMPIEPFGFSNNPVIKFAAPKFEAFKFTFDGEPMELNIVLNGG